MEIIINRGNLPTFDTRSQLGSGFHNERIGTDVVRGKIEGITQGALPLLQRFSWRAINQIQ